MGMLIVAALGCSPSVQPAPPPPPQAPAVVIEGYGVRLAMTPPIQVLRGFAGSPKRDELRAAWWDVSAPGAGTRTDHGLQGFRVVPHLPSDPSASLVVEQRDPLTAVHRLGADGTELIVGKGFSLARAATLTRGPDRPEWVIDPDGAAIPWTGEAYVLQSADPAGGPGWELLTNPTRPYGPWPEGDQSTMPPSTSMQRPVK